MNSELYNKTYKVPPEVLKSIQATLVSNPQGEGVKRAKNILRAGQITYQAMKRLKNFFDNYNADFSDRIQHALAGGDMMRNFVNSALQADRDAVETSKERRQDMDADVDMGISIGYDAPELNEAKKELDKNAVAVIINDDNKVLLLKRSDYEKQWMPNKWALVGGGIEKGESPEEACKREIKEETGLEIKKFVKSFTIQRRPESIEHIFACRYDGDPTDIELDGKENVGYGWYDVEEMDYLDIVPNLVEYIMLVFKKYD